MSEVTPELVRQFLDRAARGDHEPLKFEARLIGAAYLQVCEERDQLRAWREEHALANGGCVPGDAYRELADECRKQAWETLTRIAAAHRHCDCTGTFPCDVRRVVDQFGKEFGPGGSDV